MVLEHCFTEKACARAKPVVSLSSSRIAIIVAHFNRHGEAIQGGVGEEGMSGQCDFVNQPSLSDGAIGLTVKA